MAMAGFLLDHTLSANGTVTRGVCITEGAVSYTHLDFVCVYKDHVDERAGGICHAVWNRTEYTFEGVGSSLCDTSG